VYRIVLMNGGAAEYEAVLKEYTSTEDNQVSTTFNDAFPAPILYPES
jgi:hypothetical protein